VGKDGVNLDAEGDWAVEQRWDSQHLFLFLLHGERRQKCRSVSDFLDASKEMSDRSYFMFKCRSLSGRYSQFGKIVGLGNNNQGAVRYVRPVGAWYADLTTGRFTFMNLHEVSCDTVADLQQPAGHWLLKRCGPREGKVLLNGPNILA
jgi:hypothetical protein